MPLVFSVWLHGERSLRWVLCRKTFCGREAARRQRGSSRPGKHLPAPALQHFSCVNVNRHPPGLSSEPVSSCAALRQSHTSSPMKRPAGRQGQAGTGNCHPCLLGQGELDTNPAGSSKGTGISPLVLPDPGVSGGLEPAPPALRLAPSRGELGVHPSPQIQTPHTCSYLTPSVARDFNFGCICGCLYIQVLCIF